MPLINISPYCRIEVFYFNQERCDNYNAFYSSRRSVTPGYYYEDFEGPFLTKDQAIQEAKVCLCEG